MSLPKPDYAKGMKLIGHSDQGGRPDGVQLMINKGHAFVGHMFSKGFSVIDVRDPRNPKPSVYMAAQPNTWNIHLQTHDDLLLVINAKDMFAAAEFQDEHAYYKGALGKKVGTADGQVSGPRDWTAGMAVYDTMKLITSPITVIVTGMAASMGSILLSAGPKGRRLLFPHSRVLIHQPLISGRMVGPATDINIQAKEISMEAKSGAINAKAKQDIAIDGMNVNVGAKQKVALEAKMDASMKGMNLKLEGQMNVDTKAGVQNKMTGLMTNVESQAINTVKGAMVMVN